MADLCKIVSGSTRVADNCVNLLSSNNKSKSGASDKDITKSAKFVLSNKYYSKNDGIKILEDCIKKKVTRATNGKSDMERFMKEVARSTKSGYFEDVLLKVNYLDSNKKLTGKSGKVLCSKEYNNCVSKFVMGGLSLGGYVGFGKLVTDGLWLVAQKLNSDLYYGIKHNDYIKKENVDNIKKQIADLEKCGQKKYNLIDKVNKLDWFVGGDENKILKLQKMLNLKGAGKVLIEDGVYGKVTEDTWLKFFDKLLRLSEYGPVITNDNSSENWVKGIGLSKSAYAIVGVSAGKSIYVDDELNIAIMNNYKFGVESNFEASIAVNYEKSTNANNVLDMSGKSVSFGGGGQIPYTKIGGGVEYSRSFTDSNTLNSVTSVSGVLSGGVGLSPMPASADVGISNNVCVVAFNPKLWIRNYLNIE